MDENCVLIPLSKTGKKYAGKYTAIVSPEDADLADFDWNVKRKTTRQYAHRNPGSHRNGKKRESIHLHRIILERKLGRHLEKHEFVDHINGCGLDNRRENLRVATMSQNLSNRGKQSDNVSGYKGVSWVSRDRKWMAQIRKNGKRISLGHFDNPEEAYAAYCEAAIKYHGEFANFGTEPNQKNGAA